MEDQESVAPVRCHAKCKRSQEQCKRWASMGQKVCAKHGGAAPQNLAKAAERLAEDRLQRQITRAIGKLHIEAVEDPLTALKLLAGEVTAWKEAVREHIYKLKHLRYATEFTEQVYGEVLVYERAMDRCAMVLGIVAKLNIDDRLAAVTERQAEMLESALFAAFDAAGLSMEDAQQKRAVAKAFAGQLRMVG